MRTAALAAALAMLPVTALAAPSCGLFEQPQHTVELEQTASADSLSNNRGTWQEQDFTAIARNGTASSAYIRAESDQRFGATDNDYEMGTYFAATPHVLVNATGSYSPQHNFLPASAEEFGIDDRAAGGFGYQAGYGVRNYPTLLVQDASLGADRYWGDDHLQYTVTFSHLTNIPGLAFSQSARYQRYLPCDTVSFSLGGGRDVESTGINAVAVYKMVNVDADETHWFTSRLGVHVGAGLYLLTGAYNRFEVRFAVRERI